MSPQLLLFAEPLVATGLKRLLEDQLEGVSVITAPSALQGAPELVIWRPENGSDASLLRREALLLRERWQPGPLLTLLPPGHRFAASALLDLPAHGLLEAPSPDQIIEAVNTLRSGGRVVQLSTPATGTPSPSSSPPASGVGLGQWLLVSGLEQIDTVRAQCRRLLDPPPANPLHQWMLEGRLRELACARQLLLLLWGPVSLAWGLPEESSAPAPDPADASRGTQLTLQQRNAEGIWLAVRGRLENSISAGLANRSGQLLAIEGLSPARCADLLLALLDQLDGLRAQLAAEPATPSLQRERWVSLQPQLREQALRAMASPYVQLPRQGALQPVAKTLIESSDLAVDDPELPDAQPMLATLVMAQPLLVDGQLLAADELRAILHLERLVANWLVRTAELLAAEVLACCGPWPELRRYLLKADLLSTRNLERLRNQLNAQQRWSEWFERPIALYESRRRLLCVDAGTIGAVNLLEPRDAELRRLRPLQQLVTLALETRDALAPQLRQLIQGVGNLVVVVLTQVVGRAIGLIGRGILQGMGRGVSRP